MRYPSLTITDIKPNGEYVTVQLTNREIKLAKDCLVLVTTVEGHNGRDRKTRAADMQIGEEFVCYHCAAPEERGGTEGGIGGQD